MYVLIIENNVILTISYNTAILEMGRCERENNHLS